MRGAVKIALVLLLVAVFGGVLLSGMSAVRNKANLSACKNNLVLRVIVWVLFDLWAGFRA